MLFPGKQQQRLFGEHPGKDLDRMQTTKSFHSERSIKAKVMADVSTCAGDEVEGMRLMPLTPMPVVSESRWREQQEQQKVPRSNWSWRGARRKENPSSKGQGLGAFSA